MARVRFVLVLISLVVTTIAAHAQSADSLHDVFDPTYERILVPVLTPPVQGAYGSEFHTQITLAAKEGPPITIYGLELACTICVLPPLGLQVWPEPTTAVSMQGKPGRFIYVRRDEVNRLSANLRVYDVTREALNFGTEIRMVREDEFKTTIDLIGIPTDPRFRSTLRIYGVGSGNVLVSIGEASPFAIPTARDDVFEPSYVVFTDFPTGVGPVRVRLYSESAVFGISPPPPGHPIWALVTVTNNETQMITTITPQP